MSRRFVYKLMYDSGGAPCVADGLLSLAICKPQIRRSAVRGDWVYGFGGNNDDPPNRLVFIAKVSQRIPSGRYYELSEFADRADAIYAWDGHGQLTLRADAKFHVDVSDHVRQKDIGTYPGFDKANVLISDDYRYFGHKASDRWKSSCPHLVAAVEELGQGHLVRHSDDVLRELESLQKRLWRRHRTMDLGHPTNETGQTAGPCR